MATVYTRSASGQEFQRQSFTTFYLFRVCMRYFIVFYSNLLATEKEMIVFDPKKRTNKFSFSIN